MKLYVCSFLLSILFLSINLNKLNASQFIQLNNSQLIKRAQHIVSGTVEKINTYLENDTPFEYIEIKINTVYKTIANAELIEGDSIIIRQMGGEIDGISLDIEGLARFEEKTNVFLTLKEGQNGYFIVAGNEQGKFDIVDDDQLIRDTSESVFVRKGIDGTIQFNPGVKAETASLKSILKIIDLQE